MDGIPPVVTSKETLMLISVSGTIFAGEHYEQAATIMNSEDVDNRNYESLAGHASYPTEMQQMWAWTAQHAVQRLIELGHKPESVVVDIRY